MKWIIGDIHGAYDQLSILIEQVELVDADPTYYFTGDYCDRGPDSKKVVDLIISMGDTAKCIRGNHDDIWDGILRGTGTEYAEPDMRNPHGALQQLHWFLEHGLDETFKSYGIDQSQIERYAYSTDTLHYLSDQVPQSHKDFYHSLPLYLEDDDFYVVHAYLSPNAPHPESLAETHEMYKWLLWNRFETYQIMAKKQWQKFAYFGHTPIKRYKKNSVVTGPSMALIDTGSCFPGHYGLSAVCHNTDQVINVRLTGKVHTYTLDEANAFTS